METNQNLVQTIPPQKPRHIQPDQLHLLVQLMQENTPVPRRQQNQYRNNRTHSYTYSNATNICLHMTYTTYP